MLEVRKTSLLTAVACIVSNVGPDEVVVYDGPEMIETQDLGPAGGPKLIDYGIDFRVPFPYDPSKGNLLWELTIIGGCPWMRLPEQSGLGPVRVQDAITSVVSAICVRDTGRKLLCTEAGRTRVSHETFESPYRTPIKGRQP